MIKLKSLLNEIAVPFQAKWIKVSGEIIPVNPKNGKDFQLDELKKFIGGGYIEIIRPLSKSGAIMVIDEEGKLKGFPRNELATKMWQQFAQQGSMRMDDDVVGDVLLCHVSQVE